MRASARMLSGSDEAEAICASQASGVSTLKVKT